MTPTAKLRVVRPVEQPARLQTLGDVLRYNARVHAHGEAATDGTARVSWQELLQRAESACSQFRSLGVKRGDRIAVVLPNQLETLVLYWACALWGAIFVGASPRLGHDDLRRILDHSGAVAAFLAETVDPAVVPRATGAIVVSDRIDPAQFFNVVAPLDEDDLPLVEDGEAFAIVYTSGTTGSAKGVLLTHRNLVWNASATAEALAIQKSDSFLVAVQITHIFGMSAAVLVAALRGARCVLMREHAAGRALDLCEWEGITIHHGSPTMFLLELAAQRRAPRDLSALRTGIVAAAPVEPALADAIRAELHCDIEIAWGLTETSPTLTITRPYDAAVERRTSVGRPLPGADVRLDDVGGEYGEILARSPGVFGGYFNDPAASAAVLTEDGYFRTGDLGWIDEDGFLHLAGRVKEIIIRSGLHVYPDELESLIRTLPWVASVAVVGIADKVLGERVCVCVVERPGAQAPQELLGAVRAAIAGRLADYKLPDVVVRVSELPRSAAGKILKNILRENAMAEIAAQ
ncbi:MAG TPA: class I adenylate-forming enzyme family protein [Candidatus Baltobacteraceae bacterium]|jgi:acyl-CoA synthetase (AMP-forming)/AMP-acid ligase II|nr:class I adenylate-forming enzyme family protein [Candidatus Baltobacteraceae bacterium]